MSDLEGLLEHLGIKLGRSTDYEVYGLCPGHKKMLGREDRRPTTWSATRSTGAHHCFSCGYGGSLAELIVDCGGAPSFWGALGVMREFGIDPTDPDDLPRSYHARRTRFIPPAFLDEEDLSGFTNVPDAMLDKRSLTRESVDFYGVRWDPEEKMWITPVRLIGGALLGWQAKNKRVFLNHPPKVSKNSTLFGIDVFEPGSLAILVESPLDVCRLYAAGIEGGVSSMGVAVSDEQMRLLLSVTDQLVLALDNDDIGRSWTRRLITGKFTDSKGRPKDTTPWAAKFETYVLNYDRTPDAKDVGEMVHDDDIIEAIETAYDAFDWVS